MGMFDYVRYDAKCHQCGAQMDEFQSKDGECMMDTLNPEDVSVFYGICRKCGAWNQYKVVKQMLEIIPDHEREWR